MPKLFEKSLSVEEASYWFDYDPVDGQLMWRDRPSNRVRVGAQAGSINKVTGYLYVGVRGTNYYVHRIAWALAYGEFPSLHVDHVNGIKSDNKISNLRLASSRENSQNIRGLRANNTSGFHGVYRDRRTGRWIPQIRIEGGRLTLGTFATPEEASAAYERARAKHHLGFLPLGGC